MNDTNTNNTIPNTPSELVRNNTTTTPEEVWERVTEMSPSELQVFTWNCVNRLHQFHQLVTNDKLENGDDDNTLPVWIKDTTLLRVCKETMEGLSQN